MKPTFSALQKHYPKSETREDLYAEIGWSDVVKHPAFQDTCAIRMSIALLRARVPLLGANMKAKGGSLAGRGIETGQGRLSGILKRLWGRPEVYKDEKAAVDGIGTRSGVVSFFRIRQLGSVVSGGHIDLITSSTSGFQECARSCYFSAMEIWFWPIK